MNALKVDISKLYTYMCVCINSIPSSQRTLLMFYKVSVDADYIIINCENCTKRIITLCGEDRFLVLQRLVHVVTAGIYE